MRRGPPAIALLITALLVLAAAQSAQYDGRPLNLAALTPRGARTLWESAPRCNVINEQFFSWNELDFTNRLPPKRLNKNFTSVAPSVYGPFQHENRLAFQSDTIYYVDTDADGVEKCFSLQLVGYGENFKSYADLMGVDATNSDPLASLTNTGTDPVGLYLNYYAERSRTLMFDTRDPKQLSAADTHVAWVEAPLGAPATRTDLRVYLVSETSTVDAGAGPVPDGSSRVSVETCGPFVAYTQFQRGGAGSVPASTVYLSNLDLGANEALNSPLRGRRAFLSQLDSLNSSAYGGEDGYACVAGWLETAAPLFVDSDLFLAPDPAACLSDASLHLLLLPARDAYAFSRPDWSSPSYPAHVCVTNFRISGGHALLALSDPAGSSHILRLYSVDANSWTDVPGSLSSLPLSLVAESAGAFVLYRGTGASREAWVLRWGGTPADSWHFAACSAFTSSAARPVLSLAIYRDQVVWKELDAATGAGRFSILDLDKDNDGVFDANDVFPTAGDSWLDSDNDGIGDEADIWAAAGPCVTSAARSACTSDLINLYIVYGCVVFVTVALMAGFLVYYWRYTRGLRVVPADPYENSVSGGNVFAAMNSGGPPGRTMSISSEGGAAPAAPPRPPPSVAVSAAPRASLAGSPTSSFVVNRRASDPARTSAASPAPTPAPAAPRNPFLERLEIVVQLGLLLMTLVSLALAVVPYYPYGGISTTLSTTFVWIDFFFSTFFALDLIMRWLIRDRKEVPTLWAFVKANWADIPSLLTDIPGVGDGGGGLGVLNIIVITRFARAFRFFRFFKVFRAFRAYRRISRQNVFVILIVERPVTFLSVFTGTMVLGASIVLKIVEQREQVDFRDLGNVIWFALGTLGTIGYGDLAPRSVVGRAVSILVACMGIGLLGALSAKIVQHVLAADRSHERVLQQKKEAAERRKSERRHVEIIAAVYNPMNAILKYFAPHGEGEKVVSMVRAAGIVKQRLKEGAPPPPAKEPAKEPAPEPTPGGPEGAAGAASVRFRKNAPSPAPGGAPAAKPGLKLDLAAAAKIATENAANDDGPKAAGAGGAAGAMTNRFKQTLKSARAAVKALASFAVRADHQPGLPGRTDGAFDVPVADRLEAILKSYGLHNPRRSGLEGDFKDLWREISELVFDPPKQNKLYVEKCFSMQHHMTGDDGRQDARFYDLADPLDEKELALDDLMFKYGVSRRPDYDEIRDQVHLVILMHDRLQCAKWAVENLRYRVNVRPAPPLLNADYAKNGGKKNNRWRSALSKLKMKGGLAAAAAAAAGPADGGAGAAGAAPPPRAAVGSSPKLVPVSPGSVESPTPDGAAPDA